MPCRDYYDDHPEEYFGAQLKDKDAEIAKLKKQVSFAESALCATLNSLEAAVKTVNTLYLATSSTGIEAQQDMYDYIDFKEAGISKQALQNWRERHQELDQKHRAEEAARKKAKMAATMKKRRAEQLRANALEKLTVEERAALGLK